MSKKIHFRLERDLSVPDSTINVDMQGAEIEVATMLFIAMHSNKVIKSIVLGAATGFLTLEKTTIEEYMNLLKSKL